MTRAVVVPIGRPTFDLEQAAEEVAAAWSLLEATAMEVLGEQTIVTEVETLDDRLELVLPTAPDLLIVLQATFSDSSLVGRIADRSDVPMLVWSFPEARTGERLRLNALCGANLAAFLLRGRHHPVEFVHVDPRADEAADAVRAASVLLRDAPGRSGTPVHVRAAASRDGVSGRRSATIFDDLRIGVVGDPPTGFEPCAGDSEQIRATTGLQVDRVPLDTLFAEARATDEQTRHAISERMHATMDIDPDVEAAGLDESIGLYGGLSHLAETHGWTALATRCWPECMVDFGGAVCTPMAMLTENGVPAVCEADVFGAATALVLHRLSGSEPFVADLVDADDRDNTSVVWHCGVAARTLADPAERPVGITHPNRHRALANQFSLRPGRVTVCRLSQSGGEINMVIGGGEMLARPRPFQGTCGVLRWDVAVEDVLSTVFDRGLEHHLGIVYGEYRDELAALAAEWDIPVVHLGRNAA